MRQQSDQERSPSPHWLASISVQSVEDATRHAEQLGGRTLVAPTETSAGRFSLIADPQGARFAVIARRAATNDSGAIGR